MEARTDPPVLMREQASATCILREVNPLSGTCVRTTQKWMTRMRAVSVNTNYLYSHCTVLCRGWAIPRLEMRRCSHKRQADSRYECPHHFRTLRSECETSSSPRVLSRMTVAPSAHPATLVGAVTQPEAGGRGSSRPVQRLNGCRRPSFLLSFLTALLAGRNAIGELTAW